MLLPTDYLDGVPAGGIFVFSFKDYLAVSQIQRENCPRICIPNPGQCDVDTKQFLGSLKKEN